MRHVNKLVAAAVGALALAGCGGSSGAGSGSLTTAQLVSKVNAICTQVNNKIAALPAIHTSSDLLSTGAREMTMTTAALVQLKALDAPAGQKAALARYVAGIGQESTLASQLLVAVKAGDAGKMKTLSARAGSLSAADNANARTLGFAQCARDVQPAG